MVDCNKDHYMHGLRKLCQTMVVIFIYSFIFIFIFFLFSFFFLIFFLFFANHGADQPWLSMGAISQTYAWPWF